MIKFLTALVDEVGNVVGCNVSDMPAPVELLDPRHQFVSVGIIVSRGGVDGTLSAHLLEHITITRDADAYRAELSDAAREFVTLKIAHPTTMAELDVAPAINPLAAHWLHRLLHADHPLKTRLAGEVGNPRHDATIDNLLRRRFCSHETTPLQRHEKTARQIQDAANTRAELTAAVEPSSPSFRDPVIAADWAAQLAAAAISTNKQD